MDLNCFKKLCTALRADAFNGIQFRALHAPAAQRLVIFNGKPVGLFLNPPHRENTAGAAEIPISSPADVTSARVRCR